MHGLTTTEQCELLQRDIEDLYDERNLFDEDYMDLNSRSNDLRAEQESLFARVARLESQNMQLQSLLMSKENFGNHLLALANQPDPHEIFPFFKLSAELRTMILEECLIVGKVFPRPKPKHDHRLDDVDDYKKPVSQLLCVSRQMRAEAAPIFFQQNTFVISSGVDSWPWKPSFGNSTSRLESLYDLATKFVRHLNICFDVRDHPGGDRDPLERARDEDYTPLPDIVHFEQEVDYICPSWSRRHNHYETFSLDTLVADFANYFCSRGCCELESNAIDDFLFSWKTGPFPKKIVVKNLLTDYAVTKYPSLLCISGKLQYLHRLILEDHERPDADMIMSHAGWGTTCRTGDDGEEIEVDDEVTKQWFADNWVV